MSKTIEVLYVANTHHRITITPTRATLKIVPGTPENECEQLRALFARAQEKFIDTLVSVRASVKTSETNARFRTDGGITVVISLRVNENPNGD